MKKTIVFILLFSPAFLWSQLIVPKKLTEEQRLIRLHHASILKELENENYQEVRRVFTEGLKEKLDTARLRSSWEKLYQADSHKVELLDDFSIKRTAEAEYYLSGFQLGPKKYDLQTRFILDDNQKLRMSSFRITPFQNKSEWSAPSYVDIDQVECKELKIAGPDSLYAELCFPKGSDLGQTPIAVFVHGSGPNDMNESLGPNRLFKDLAYGLASNGVASIRYNKRTYDYPFASSQEPSKLTASTLVLDDAVSAIERARKYSQSEIYLIGHSLGGYFAPAIAERANPDKVISLAGNLRPLEDLIIEQFDYLRANDSSNQINDFVYNSVKWQIKNLKEGNYDSSTIGATLPLGVPGSFWLSVKEYHAGETAKNQDIPYLILNGSRDYQVTEKEAMRWKKYLKHKNSEVVILEGMNHMFYKGEGLLLPAEYEEKAEVNEEVLTEILQWLQNE